MMILFLIFGLVLVHLGYPALNMTPIIITACVAYFCGTLDSD